MSELSTAASVVVGVDGSRAATQAALWAVDEAVDRDVPLRLLCAVDDTSTDPEDASAEKTIRNAARTIKSLGKPVTVEAEIVHRRPVAALAEASRAAAVVCVGSIGFHHALRGRIGSTASAVATAAHCPVAIVPRTGNSATGRTGLVLAVVDGSSATDCVLELSVAEARLRASPLRVFTRHQPRPARPNDTATPSDQRLATELERRVAHWRKKHPDLNVELVSDHNGMLNYLEHLQRNAVPIQLVVLDPRRPGPLDVLLGPAGRAVLEAAGCTVMICDRRRWL